MTVVKTLAEFVNHAACHAAAFLLLGGNQFLQGFRRMLDQIAVYFEVADFGGGKFVFEIAEDAFANGHEAAGAGLLVAGEFGDLAQAIIVEKDIDAVGGEGLLILADDAAFGALENGKEVVDLERMADNAGGSFG